MKKILSILMLLVAIVTGAWATDLVVSNTSEASETFADGSILYSIDSDGRVTSSTKFASDKDIVVSGVKTKGAAFVDKRFAIKFPVAVTSVTIYGYNSSSGRTLSKVSTSTTMAKDSYTEITTTKNSSSATPNYNYTFTASWTNAIAANTAIWFEFNNSCNFYKISYTGAAPATTYTVTYKANNGTEESDVVDNTATKAAANTFTAPSGKAFSGWNTEADGTGDAYAVNDAISTDNLVLFAQWVSVTTLFSMTEITGPTEEVVPGATASVAATFSTGASAEVKNGHGSNNAVFVQSGTMTLNSSGASYLHIVLPTKLLNGDVISFGDLTGAIKVGKTTNYNNANTKTFPYTITASDGLAGEKELYFFKDGSATFTSVTIQGAGAIPNLAVTSSTTPSVNVGETSEITYDSPSKGDVTYTTSDANVATVSDAGVITAVGGGTATITINQDADKTYRAGYATVTVTVVETAMIKVKLNGTGAATVTGNISGVSAEKSGIENGNKFGKGAYVTLTLPTGYTFQAGDILNVNITTASGGGKVIKIYDPEHKDEDHVWYNTNELGVVGDNKFVLPAALEGKSSFSICRTSGNQWNAVVAFISVTRPNAVITLNANGYATYSSAKDFEFLGATAYGMELTTTSLTGHEATGKIKAGEGILFKGEPNAKVYITETTGAEALTNNSLIGTTDADNEIISSSYTYKYALSGDTFKRLTGALVANKAFFGTNVELSNSLDLIFDGATAINNVNANDNAKSVAPVKVIKNGQLYIGNYNVAGQQVK